MRLSEEQLKQLLVDSYKYHNFMEKECEDQYSLGINTGAKNAYSHIMIMLFGIDTAITTWHNARKMVENIRMPEEDPDER